MKKFISLLFAMILVISSAIPVFADVSEEYYYDVRGNIVKDINGEPIKKGYFFNIRDYYFFDDHNCIVTREDGTGIYKFDTEFSDFVFNDIDYVVTREDKTYLCYDDSDLENYIFYLGRVLTNEDGTPQKSRQ